MAFIRNILVRDGNGDHINLYQFKIVDRLSMIGLRRNLFKLELDTGEAVEQIDEDTFAVVATGEKLTRIA